MTATAPGVALITGGGGAVGRATAQRLAARGAPVALVDIDPGALADAARAIRAGGGVVETFGADVRDRTAVERVVRSVEEQLGAIAWLFSNARTARPHPVGAMPLAGWNDVLETHLTGSFLVCQAVLRGMVRRRQGAIVLGASDYAIVGLAEAANAAAAQAGLYSLTKCLALEFAPHGIRVNAIGPGPIEAQSPGGGAAEEGVGRWRGPVPMGRPGRADEVAAVVEFLLSDRAAYITGQLVQPDGGRVMW